MPHTVLMIPKRDDLSGAALTAAITSAMAASNPTPNSLPFVAGECQLEGYRNMILIESIRWETDVEAELSVVGRRTVQTPQMRAVQITRKLDLSTGTLARLALTARISQVPWELYFLRDLGGEDGFTGDTGVMHGLFMTVKLHFPLVTKYAFDIGEGEGQEEIEVTPSAMEWIYQPADSGQQLLGVRSVKFDLQAGGFT